MAIGLSEAELHATLEVLTDTGNELLGDYRKLKDKAKHKRNHNPKLMLEIVGNALKLCGISKLIVMLYEADNDDGSNDKDIADVKENIASFEEIIDKFENVVSKAVDEKVNCN